MALKKICQPCDDSVIVQLCSTGGVTMNLFFFLGGGGGEMIEDTS